MTPCTGKTQLYASFGLPSIAMSLAVTALTSGLTIGGKARAMPNAADTELDAWPAMKASWTLSSGLGKPASPDFGTDNKPG